MAGDSIIVIGGGVIGCSIAFELTRRGMHVTTIEGKKKPFAGMSASAFGSLTPFSDPYFKGAASDFAQRGVDLYRTRWLTEVGCDNGAVSFTDLGLIELFDAEPATSHGASAKRLTMKDVHELEPQLGSSFAAAIWYDEPWLNALAYFEALHKKLLESPKHSFELESRVTAVSFDTHGSYVSLEDGRKLAGSHIVLASGLSRATIQGVPALPLQWVRGDFILVRHPRHEDLLSRHVYFKKGFITPRNSGRLLLGATYDPDSIEEVARTEELRTQLTVKAAANLIEMNERLLPRLEEYEIESVGRGWRPTAPDKMPLLGSVNGNRRLIIANGFIGLGVTMAPAVAEAVAEFLLDGKRAFPHEFDPNRSFAINGELNVAK